MKKITSLVLVSTLLCSNIYAQKKGFLNNLKSELKDFQEQMETGSPKPNEKDLQKDMESTALDKLPINKDSRNISGIYYLSEPVRIGLSYGKINYKFAKKVLINYTEGELNEIEMTTRYHVENKTESKPLVWAPKPGTPDYFPVTNSKKLGHLLIDGISSNKHGNFGDQEYAWYFTRIFMNTPPKVNPASWGFAHNEILQLEDGILVATIMEYSTDANTPEKYKFVQENGHYVLFYKKEKEAIATKWSKAEVWDKIKAFYSKYDALLKEAEANKADLVKPVNGFKDEPSNAALVKAAKDRMSKMKYYTEDFVYLYPATSWENRYENVGIMGKTLTHRVMQVQVILKKGNECKATQMLMRQDNAYQAGSSIEKFSGNEIFCIGDIEKTTINCDKAMKYKK